MTAADVDCSCSTSRLITTGSAYYSLNVNLSSAGHLQCLWNTFCIWDSILAWWWLNLYNICTCAGISAHLANVLHNEAGLFGTEWGDPPHVAAPQQTGDSVLHTMQDLPSCSCRSVSVGISTSIPANGGVQPPPPHVVAVPPPMRALILTADRMRRLLPWNTGTHLENSLGVMNFSLRWWNYCYSNRERCET